MPDYKADLLASKQRSYEVIIRNPLGAYPSVEYKEEIVTINTSDGTVVMQQRIEGALSATIEDMSLEIPLYNPTDGTVIGTMPISNAYVAIYSAYRYFADIRDNASVGG